MNIKDCFSRGFLVKVSPSWNKVKQSLDVAESNIKKAKDNLEIRNYDVCVVLAYTSMFHSLRAILFKEGVKERSHICLLAYIKSKYPRMIKLLNNIDSYRRFRHTALYGLEELVSKDEANRSIKVAKETLSFVNNILGR